MKILLLIFIILAAFLSIMIVISFFFYDISINPNSAKNKKKTEDDSLEYEKDFTWFDAQNKKSIFLIAYDNLQLHADLILHPHSSKWAILCHGYTSYAKKMAYQAEHFFNMGYNILIPDARGHGQSEGKYIGMGWHERLDIIRWAQWITTQYQNTKITLYGISMGAATVMMTAGEKLPCNVKCIIEDCGYASVRGEFQHVLNHYMKIPSFPILQISAIHTKLRAGYNYLKEGNAAEQLKKSHIPILFIHGQQDTFVPFSMMQTVYEAAAGEKQTLIIPDAGHAECCMKNPDLYWKTIYHFLNHYIPEESSTQKQAHA